MSYKFDVKGEIYRFILIIILLAIAILLTYYSHFVIGQGVIFTHFFYVPIILAAFWWQKKGLIVPIFLASILLISSVSPILTYNIYEDLIRASMFIVVGLVVAFLSYEINQREDKLRDSENKFRSVSESAVDGIITTDTEGRIVIINHSTEKIFGYFEGELKGKLVDMLMPERLRENFRTRLKNLYSEDNIEKTPYESMGLRKDGTEFTFEISQSVWSFEGKNFTTSIIRDISERKKTEQKLEKSLQKLLELDKLKSMFIASMSHELRTPLNSIIGFTGIILQGMVGDINDEQKKQLQIVKNSANHLLGLINDVIDISKIESDKIDLYIEELDLKNILIELKDSFRESADKKGLKLDLNMAERIMIAGDERRIKQVIMNLMSNAVKFSQKGQININVEKKDENVEISVMDTGMGIKKEDMSKLFKAFSRINVDGVPAPEGTGLGLYLSKKLAHMMGGDITASSEFGKGSIFTFILPLKIMEIK